MRAANAVPRTLSHQLETSSRTRVAVATSREESNTSTPAGMDAEPWLPAGGGGGPVEEAAPRLDARRRMTRRRLRGG
eukprot:11546943-Alexandrium_andersonii.AAC.1